MKFELNSQFFSENHDQKWRRFRYRVSFPMQDYLQYINVIPVPGHWTSNWIIGSEILAWANEQFGKDGWYARQNNRYNRRTKNVEMVVYFKTVEDAVLFKLRWA